MTTCVSPWLLTSDWLRSYCRWQRPVDPEPRLWNRDNTIVSSSAVAPGINSLHPRGSPAPTLFSLHSLISQSLSKKYPPVIDSAVLKRSLSDSFAALRLTGDVVVQNDVSLILHAAESSQSSVKRREGRKDIGLVRSASSSGYEACNNSISRRQVAKKKSNHVWTSCCPTASPCTTSNRGIHPNCRSDFGAHPNINGRHQLISYCQYHS